LDDPSKMLASLMGLTGAAGAPELIARELMRHDDFTRLLKRIWECPMEGADCPTAATFSASWDHFDLPR
jgi:hypothetical protein